MSDSSTHFVNIAGHEFTMTEFQRIPLMLGVGDVNAALTVLLAVKLDIENGEDRIADLTLTEYITQAIDTIASWYGDIHCDPVRETIMNAQRFATDIS